jgi:F0F1-type ATP synthase membrane subunit c/vacuolar-type H+-ATPase subunit K
LQVLIFECLGAAWPIFSFVINFLILNTYAYYYGLIWK